MRKYQLHCEVLLLTGAMSTAWHGFLTRWPLVLPLALAAFALLLTWRLYYLRRDEVRRELSDLSALQSFVNENLFSDNRWKQIRGMDHLSVVAGDRFGEVATSSRRVAEVLPRWRHWWQQNQAALVWDAQLGVYLSPADRA